MVNSNLNNAKKSKNDEFYTQYEDIEKEINSYLEYNPDVFKGKTVLLPCDDPEWSNFTLYFAQNFNKLGLKKLISTSYATKSKPEKISANHEPTLGKIFTLTKYITGGETTAFEDLEWCYLRGNGDFRSEEVIKLRDEADYIITNPPFSLFREFITWIMAGDKKFSIIGNMNAITYKEIFPFIKTNKMWLGATDFNTDMVFKVPDGSIIAESDKIKAEKMGYVGNYTRLGNSCWFTNIDHGKRHKPLQLKTMEDNLTFNKAVKENCYQKYDNYDAIEVPKVDAIPSDYKGIMGVPITFLSKYNPDQFDIIAITNKGAVPDNILIKGQPKYDRAYLNGKRMYSRILIQRKS